jgi:hypothetical protein
MKWLKICFLFLVALATLTTPVHALTLQESLGTATTLLNAELNSIGTNVYTGLSTATFDNSLAAAGNGALRCRIELIIVYSTAPTANTAWVVWLLRSADGTNFEPTPTSAIAPGSALTLSFPVNSGQTTTRGIIDIDCPAGKFKAVAKNVGTGQCSNGGAVNFLKVWSIIIQVN